MSSAAVCWCWNVSSTDTTADTAVTFVDDHNDLIRFSGQSLQMSLLVNFSSWFPTIVNICCAVLEDFNKMF